jgi:hypothetical protein
MRFYRALAHDGRSAARSIDDGNKAKARVHLRHRASPGNYAGFGGDGVRPTRGKVTLVSSDLVPFVVDVEVAHMFDVMRAMEVDDTELVPVPDVDGPTLEKALEYCKAHAPSARGYWEKMLAWDEAYARSVGSEMLLDLVDFATKWGCEGLMQVLSKSLLLMMIAEYGSVGALRRAFDVRDDFTENDQDDAAALEPTLIRDLRRTAFHWSREYFRVLQHVMFHRYLADHTTISSIKVDEGAANHPAARVAANDWFYTAFLARLRCLRGDSDSCVQVSGLAARLLRLRTSVWRMMFEHLRDIRVDYLASISRNGRLGREERFCSCGVPIGTPLIAHGYYESDTHQQDLENLRRACSSTARHELRRELVFRPHSGKGLLRFAPARGGFWADLCAHQGQPWTVGS